METIREQIARVTSSEECIVTGCRLEDGHAGPHEYGTPESKPLLSPTSKAPYGRCGECHKPVEPHGVTCAYCFKPYGPFPASFR